MFRIWLKWIPLYQRVWACIRECCSKATLAPSLWRVPSVLSSSNNAASVADLITACQCVCTIGSFVFHVDHLVLQTVCTKARLLLINTSTIMTGWSKRNVPSDIYAFFFYTFSYLRVCKRAYTHRSTRVCATIWLLAIFRMATYQFNMLHSPLDSSPCAPPRPVTSFPVVAGTEDDMPRLHAASLSDIFLFTLYLLEPSSRQRGEKSMSKNNIITLKNSYSFEHSGSAHHIYLEEANWFNFPCLHHA